MPELAPWQWILGAACACFVGMAKTGVPGLGILVVPLMVVAVGSARASAGWLLPLLCAADVFAILYYRRHASLGRVARLVPWVLVGVAGGAAALGLPDGVLRPVVGAIVLVMIGAHLARKLRADRPVPDGWAYAAGFGAAAGFATTVANAAGPVMNVYLLSRRLPKEEFIAAGAWFFFAINLFKLPIYGARGMLTGPSLLFDALMLPAVAVGAVAGRAVLRRLPQRAFELAVLGLTAIAGIVLIVP